jgi:branched-chain amino acid transport system ATP-binding protein
MIEVENVSRAFNMLRAVDGVNLSVGKDEIVGIIGTNGSGKTTLLNLITGYLAPTSGRIVFEGTDITGLGPRRITEWAWRVRFRFRSSMTGSPCSIMS